MLNEQDKMIKYSYLKSRCLFIYCCKTYHSKTQGLTTRIYYLSFLCMVGWGQLNNSHTERAVRKQSSHKCLYFSHYMAGYFLDSPVQFPLDGDWNRRLMPGTSVRMAGVSEGCHESHMVWFSLAQGQGGTRQRLVTTLQNFGTSNSLHAIGQAGH